MLLQGQGRSGHFDFPFGFDKMEGFGDYDGNGFVDMMGKKGWRG